MAKAKAKEVSFDWSPKNGWDGLTKREEKSLEKYCSEYMEFLSKSKTERLAYTESVKLAEAHGYVNISEKKKLKAGDKIYIGFNGKTIMLVNIGNKPLTDGLRIVGGHTDAPRLDSKPVPLYEDGGVVLLDTSYYGGIRKYHWVSSTLAIHGVVVKEDGSKVDISIGEDLTDPIFTITDLLPHLAAKQSKLPLSTAITGEGLNVLVGSRPIDKKSDKIKNPIKENILKILNEKYGITEEDFVSAELEIVPAGPAREIGFDRSMIGGYGHDDRVCAYAGLRAALDMKEIPEYTSVVLMCDKEEIGSEGNTGMNSFFFENTVAEVLALENSKSTNLNVRRCLSRSKMLSADVCCLHDPNYPDVSAPNGNMAKMNHGCVLVKYTGSRGKSGGSDASAEFVGEIRSIFNEAKVCWQMGLIGKVDEGGGGTISKFMARYGMEVIDCGVGLFGMHSTVEVAGKIDIYMTYKGYKAFFEKK